MRVAVPIDHLRARKGGLEAWLFALAERLAARGDEVHSLTMDEVPPGEPFRHHPLPPEGLTRVARDRSFARLARDACAPGRFDVVLGLRHLLACDVYAPHGGSVAAAFEAHRRARARPLRPSRKVRNFLDLERRLLTGPAAPSAVVAVSNRVRDDLVRRYPALADRIRVVPNGVDLERYSPSGREAARARLAPGEGPVLLFAAGDPRLKGYRSARAVFRRLAAAGGAPRLLVAGARVGRLPAGAVHLGRPADLTDALRAADVLLLPTWYDPFPLLTLEALACGTPVVTTRANGAVAHVGEGDAVRAVDTPEDVEGLLAAVRAILEAAPCRDARGRAERFPVGASLDATIGILEAVSRRVSPGSGR